MALIDDLKQIFPNAGASLQADVPMSSHTTFKIGGPADIYFEPSHAEEIVTAIRHCQQRGIPYLIIGNGSNILVADAGIRGVVISIGDRYSGIGWQDGKMLVKAGTRLAALSGFAAQHGFCGLEFASGIPGTLGGAILMNAGAYEHCMADIVTVTEYLDDHLDLRQRRGADHQFNYRDSFFSSRNCIILQAYLQLTPDDPAAIMSRITILSSRRRASQPLDLPSAGSAFKRPDGQYAGKLISDCGLKGFRLGNAQVSEKHAGFIVNLGQARADDIRRLFEKIQEIVASRTGVLLEPEVRFVGDWRHWPVRQ
jgi:UDP-N-acetylmuramate dehydrogenase